jgi:hypothetical protein
MTPFVRVILAGSLLGGAPCPARAQAPASTPAPLPRYYVGVQGLALNRYQVFYPEASPASAGPWQLVLGGQLAPRWALQVGFSYHVRRDRSDRSDPELNGDVVDRRVGIREPVYCLPVLARYAAVGFARSRGQLEAVAGATLVGAAIRFDEQYRVNGQLVRQSSYGSRSTNGYVTAGAGVRYAVGPRWEGVFDWTYSCNVNFLASSAETNRRVANNRFGLTPAVGVGVRYRFHGRSQPAAL